MAKLKVKFNTKGSTFKEIYGLTPEQMNELANKDVTEENTQRVHKAMFCNALLNTNGHIPVAIMAAAFTDNPDYRPEVVVPVSSEAPLVMKKLYKKIGHAGVVKMIAAIEENNVGVTESLHDDEVDIGEMIERLFEKMPDDKKPDPEA